MSSALHLVDGGGNVVVTIERAAILSSSKRLEVLRPGMQGELLEIVAITGAAIVEKERRAAAASSGGGGA